MEARVTYSLVKSKEVINLEEYGHDEDTEWSDLSEDEQNEIRDALREEFLVYVEVENHLDF